MSISIRALFETLRILPFGSIQNLAYTAIGSPFANPARQIYIQNTTNGLLCFSIDGVNDHFVVPAQGFLLVDTTSNKTIDQGFFFAQNLTMYVRYISAPTSGSVYVSVVHGFERAQS